MTTLAWIGFWLDAAVLAVTLVKMAEAARPEPVPVKIEDDE